MFDPTVSTPLGKKENSEAANNARKTGKETAGADKTGFEEQGSLRAWKAEAAIARGCSGATARGKSGRNALGGPRGAAERSSSERKLHGNGRQARGYKSISSACLARSVARGGVRFGAICCCRRGASQRSALLGTARQGSEDGLAGVHRGPLRAR